MLRQLKGRHPQALQNPSSALPIRSLETERERDRVEPPSNDHAKKIRCMKKKLSKLNKKVEHSKKKNNDLISKENSLRKKIEELKVSSEKSFDLVELEQAFSRAYRSYRINGRSRMDIDTLFDPIRQNLIDLMNREQTGLGSARVQTMTWIRFRAEYEDRIIDRVRLPLQ